MLSKWLGPEQSQEIGPIGPTNVWKTNQRSQVLYPTKTKEEAWSEDKVMFRRQGQEPGQKRGTQGNHRGKTVCLVRTQ